MKLRNWILVLGTVALVRRAARRTTRNVRGAVGGGMGRMRVAATRGGRRVRRAFG